MLDVKAFKFEDILDIEPKPEHLQTVSKIRSDRDRYEGRMVYDGFTARGESNSVACAGIVGEWTGRGVCWCVIDKNASLRFMVSFTSAVIDYLDRSQPEPYRRLEMTVQNGFDKALAWAMRLGFSIECIAEKYDEQGNDHILMSRIK